MTRPKKDESIRRTKNVMVRFTDVEYALVSCSAEQAGYPVAVYVRKQCAWTEQLRRPLQHRCRHLPNSEN